MAVSVTWCIASAYEMVWAGHLTSLWGLSAAMKLTWARNSEQICLFVWCVCGICVPTSVHSWELWLWRPEEDIRWPAVSLYLIPLRQDFFFPDRFCFNFLISLPGQQVPGVLFFFVIHSIGITGARWPCLTFDTGARDLNLGLHACPASTLLHLAISGLCILCLVPSSTLCNPWEKSWDNSRYTEFFSKMLWRN